VYSIPSANLTPSDHAFTQEQSLSRGKNTPRLLLCDHTSCSLIRRLKGEIVWIEIDTQKYNYTLKVGRASKYAIGQSTPPPNPYNKYILIHCVKISADTSIHAGKFYIHSEYPLR